MGVAKASGPLAATCGHSAWRKKQRQLSLSTPKYEEFDGVSEIHHQKA
jgi:hypothetical protein